MLCCQGFSPTQMSGFTLTTWSEVGCSQSWCSWEVSCYVAKCPHYHSWVVSPSPPGVMWKMLTILMYLRSELPCCQVSSLSQLSGLTLTTWGDVKNAHHLDVVEKWVAMLPSVLTITAEWSHPHYLGWCEKCSPSWCTWEVSCHVAKCPHYHSWVVSPSLSGGRCEKMLTILM